MSTPGTGDGQDQTASGGPRSKGRTGNGASGGFSFDDDGDAGDYVPGMYSGSTSTSDTASTSDATREFPAPVAASRGTRDDAPRPREDTTTRSVPVTATRSTEEYRPEVATTGTPGRTKGRQNTAVAAVAAAPLPSLEERKRLHQRQKEHFGGMKFGAAFFGWLTATGLFVLLSAVVGAVAALFGYGSNLSASDLSAGSAELQSVGTTTAVALGAILLISYFAGGYVAGRMARFSGLRQGVAVWLWAVVIAVVLTIIGLIAGNQADISERFQGISVFSGQDLTAPGLIGLLILGAITLVGALLGGLAGMRYHRTIDRMDFDAVDQER